MGDSETGEKKESNPILLQELEKRPKTADLRVREKLQQIRVDANKELTADLRVNAGMEHEP